MRTQRASLIPRDVVRRFAAPIALGIAATLAAAPIARADDSTSTGSSLVVTGFVDAFYTRNANKPADHANIFPGVGTSAKRDNEFSINLAQADLVLPPQPVGFKLSLGFGTATEVVHAAEVRGIAAHPDIWRNVVQASAQWQTTVGRGLLLEAGVYPSHIGMEAFATKDNWNYTRSWLGELSPYYQTGLKAAYPMSDRWSAQLHLLNGWQVISDNNRSKSVGGQLAYSSGKFSSSLNGIVGPELANNDDDVRALGDVVALYKAIPSLELGVSVDVARESRPSGDDSHWGGAGAYLRVNPSAGPTAFAARAEYYEDKDGAISGVPQILREVTATLEHRPAEHLILKLEARYDRSSAPVFAEDEVDLVGDPVRTDEQFLILLGAVATFAR